MKFLISILLSALIFSSCSSSSKDEPREKVIDYQLRDFSHSTIPTWIQDPETGDKEKNRKHHRYFIAESSNPNKNLCKGSASARATKQIAMEIAQFYKGSFSEAVQGGTDEEVTEYMQEQLAQEAQTFIVGAEATQSYWEKRQYLVELGAQENKLLYNCFALIRMSKDNLEKALKFSRQKLLSHVQKPEVKQKAEKALKVAEKKFVDKE